MPAILLNRIGQIRTQSERPFCEVIFARALRLICLPMKFIADRMLGKLAIWLRLMGYDTLYENTVADEELLSLLKSSPDRILLSRNVGLVERLDPNRYIFVPPDDPKAQLRFLVKALALVPNPSCFFTRCSRCNAILEQVDRGAVAGRVPEYVWTSQEVFSRCKNCGKIYWPGTHVTRFEDQLKRVLDDETVV